MDRFDLFRLDAQAFGMKLKELRELNDYSMLSLGRKIGTSIQHVLLISVDGMHSAFVGFIPMQSVQPHRQTAVTFEKYGDTDYLDRVWIEGEEYGISVDPGRVETAAEANATQHATAAGGQ